MSDTNDWNVEKIAKALTRGTSETWDKLKVLAYDKDKALVKWPGGYTVRGGHCSPWVVLVDLNRVSIDRHGAQREVWDCDQSKHGRLTKNRAAKLIKNYFDAPLYRFDSQQPLN